MGAANPDHQKSDGPCGFADRQKAPASRPRSRSLRTFLAVLAAILIMVAGYFVAGSILYGSVLTGATQIPGLVIEGVVGIVLFYVIAAALERAGSDEK